MPLSEYFAIDGDQLRIDPNQASDFAKQIAGDFNPLHDPDYRRFCVPGDLLFTALLTHVGVRQCMRFRFAGMVGAGITLNIEQDNPDAIALRDTAGKTYLEVACSGARAGDQGFAEQLARDYVAFSGQTFPHILVPLLEDAGVMINVERPMVVYESMAFDLQALDLPNVQLRLADSRLDVDAKRGDVRLDFEFLSDGGVIGTGCKRLLLSGLRPYEQDGMDRLVSTYLQRRDNYHQASVRE